MKGETILSDIMAEDASTDIPDGNRRTSEATA
jgi:hypothetical protein